jgi:hypothetical protein
VPSDCAPQVPLAPARLDQRKHCWPMLRPMLDSHILRLPQEARRSHRAALAHPRAIEGRGDPRGPGRHELVEELHPPSARRRDQDQEANPQGEPRRPRMGGLTHGESETTISAGAGRTGWPRRDGRAGLGQADRPRPAERQASRWHRMSQVRVPALVRAVEAGEAGLCLAAARVQTLRPSDYNAGATALLLVVNHTPENAALGWQDGIQYPAQSPAKE